MLDDYGCYIESLQSIRRGATLEHIAYKEYGIEFSLKDKSAAKTKFKTQI